MHKNIIHIYEANQICVHQVKLELPKGGTRSLVRVFINANILSYQIKG